MELNRLPNCAKVGMECEFVRNPAERARVLTRNSALPSQVIVNLSEMKQVDAEGETQK